MFNKQKIFAEPQDGLTDSQRITHAAIMALQGKGKVITLINIKKISGLPNNVLEDVLSGFESVNMIARVEGKEPTYVPLNDDTKPEGTTFYDWNQTHPESAYNLNDIR